MNENNFNITGGVPNKKIKLAAVVGPTASGKTALAIEAANALGGQILCCDSMQIYKGMDIGTAMPTTEEFAAAPHRMFGFLSPDASFSAADYSDMARREIDTVTAAGDLPIFCGGTGLYLDAVTAVSAYSDAKSDPALRASLMAFAAEHGAGALHARLAEADPEAAAVIHANNVVRVARALEIFESTGIPKTEWDRRSKFLESPYETAVIFLCFKDRDLLYRRIEKRVDLMLEAGILEETRALFDAGIIGGGADNGASRAIGAKELLPYLRGECSLTEAAENLKTATRRYAKRQLTWFRAKPDFIPVFADEGGEMRPLADIAAEATAKIREKLTL